MWQEIAHPRAAVAVLGKRPLGRQQVEAVAGVHESKPLAGGEALGNPLAAVGRQLRLVVEEVELRGAAGHKQKDHPLGFRRKVRRPRGERFGAGLSLVAAAKQGAERHRPYPHTAVGEEVPAGVGLKRRGPGSLGSGMVSIVHGGAPREW